MKEIKVSVLIYVLNRIAYIETCIRSVMNQTLKDIEISIIDGGSTDGTLRVIKELEHEDSRIRLISSAPGVGRQFNLGLMEAKGEYIGICESDDFILPDMYNIQYEIAKKHQLDILRADTTHFIENEEGKVYKFPIKLSLQDELYNKVLDLTEDNRILKLGINGFWSGLYRRQFLLEHQLFMNETKGAAYQDTSFSFLTLINAKRVMLSRHAFYCYRLDNPNSSVNSPQKITMLLDEYDLLKKRIKEAGWFEQYKEIYLSWKINGHLGFYDSLSLELKEQYVELMYTDLKDELDSAGCSGCELSEKNKKIIHAVKESKIALREYLQQLHYDVHLVKKELELIQQQDVILFGSGEMGKLIYQYLNHKHKNIVAYIDNNQNLWGKKMEGISIMNPSEAVCLYPNAIYIIANTSHFQLMKHQLMNLSVDDRRIIVCNDYGFFLRHILIQSLKEGSVR